MKHLSLIGVAVLVLAACNPPDKPPENATPASAPASASAPAPPPAEAASPPATNASEDICGKAQYAALVGKPATDPGVPPASRTVRHITPGMQVTMDFMPARLNIKIGPDGKITEFTCG
jgi:hypothetical protein